MHTDTFELELTGAPDALMRVLALCHRKHGTVTALRYESGDRHRPPRLELTVRAGHRAEELRRRLDALVDVVDASSPSLRLLAA